ncbi:MAG: bifunctional phosphopantothenoylcysteine decarboxylase/phosphopantothenate--cysteine ligase CoaBC [Candidatus Obscuribacterales bacterium]|nr:bifunctional phosphopantothenoylcysteine decarboxylase/phosphopantothenate--cysteine ligase CoaBC [Candidatus Obscuribacterales bacterium]
MNEDEDFSENAEPGPLKNRTVILGVCGGIAAYKACDLARGLRRAGADVHVVMTPNATAFITPLTLQTLTRNDVHVEQYGDGGTWKPEHIELAQRADLILVAPATANTIAKLANGICDDLLTTIIMAATCRVMFAPAMNPHMLEHPATQFNLGVLQHRMRYEVIPPDVGEMACGDVGAGKMASIETILATVASRLMERSNLTGKSIIVTAGGTREPIDPVRFIGNRSSGKMGVAVADAAHARGADVTLISTVHVERSYPVVVVETAHEMQEAVESEFDTCHALVMTAAVADYRPIVVSHHKIKKTESEDLVLELTKNPDILDLLGRVKRKDQIIVGFAAESEGLLNNAQQKLKRKHLDMIIGNDISVPDIGFGSDYNAVVILTAEGQRENLPRMPKRAIAEHILDMLSSRLESVQKATV